MARRRWRFRDMPLWAVVVIVMVASPAITYGVFATADYIVDNTTVTVTGVSWYITVGGQPLHEWIIACTSNAGPYWASCPYRAHSGSEYVATISLSAYFSERSLTLTTPSPFHLVSTTPSLPFQVPAAGGSLVVDIELPSSAGTYDFNGTAAFA